MSGRRDKHEGSRKSGRFKQPPPPAKVPWDDEGFHSQLVEWVTAEGLAVVRIQAGNGRIRVLAEDLATSNLPMPDCLRLHRAIEGRLRDAGVDPGAFDIEVASPGLDRPLVTLEHYRRFVESKVRVRFRAALGNGSSNLRGRLRAVEEQVIVFEAEDGKECRVELGDIAAANIIYELDTKSSGRVREAQ